MDFRILSDPGGIRTHGLSLRRRKTGTFAEFLRVSLWALEGLISNGLRAIYCPSVSDSDRVSISVFCPKIR